MSDNQETLIHNNAILDAINSLRQEMNDRVDGLRQEMNQRFNNLEGRLRFVEDKVTNIETDVRQIKDMQFVFENELDRLQAATHQSLNLAHENRADVRIMRKEIAAWSKDVKDLQRIAA